MLSPCTRSDSLAQRLKSCHLGREVRQASSNLLYSLLKNKLESWSTSSLVTMYLMHVIPATFWSSSIAIVVSWFSYLLTYSTSHFIVKILKSQKSLDTKCINLLFPDLFFNLIQIQFYFLQKEINMWPQINIFTYYLLISIVYRYSLLIQKIIL